MKLALHYQDHTKLFTVPYTAWLKDNDSKCNDENLLNDTGRRFSTFVRGITFWDLRFEVFVFMSVMTLISNSNLVDTIPLC
jgi:hypothetical protein